MDFNSIRLLRQQLLETACCSLLPEALRLNPGKITLWIQAVRKVTFAPARFWDRGARWLVVRSYVLEQQGDKLQCFSEKIRRLFEAKSCRRGRLETTLTGERNRSHAVMATRGDWKLGANGCRGASWSKESLVAA